MLYTSLCLKFTGWDVLPRSFNSGQFEFTLYYKVPWSLPRRSKFICNCYWIHFWRITIQVIFIQLKTVLKWIFLINHHFTTISAFFCHMCVFTQNWASDDHFEVLNRSKFWLLQNFKSFDTKCKYFHFRSLSQYSLVTGIFEGRRENILYISQAKSLVLL